MFTDLRKIEKLYICEFCSDDVDEDNDAVDEIMMSLMVMGAGSFQKIENQTFCGGKFYF